MGEAKEGVDSGMSWSIGHITGIPTKTLDGWSAHDVPFDGDDRPVTRHLVGCVRETGKSRASMPLVRFDVERRLAQTRSGRIYRLAGETGTCPNCTFMWTHWCRANAMPSGLDVTQETAALLASPSSALELDHSDLARMVRAGMLLTREQFLKSAGCSARKLELAIERERIFSVTVENELYFPTAFSEPNAPIQALGDLCVKLRSISADRKLRWLTTREAALGDITPVHALTVGRVQEVMNLAHAHWRVENPPVV